MKLQTEEIFTRMHGEWNENDMTLMNSEGEYVCNLFKQEAYILTPEQLKQLLEDYTNRIVENTKIDWGVIHAKGVDKETITSQLPKYLKEIGI